MPVDSVTGRQVLPEPAPLQNVATAIGVDDQTAAFEPVRPIQPPRDAPHVVIVLMDELGFGTSSSFGGPVEMPAAERLAESGLRYTRFHVTALCSPTRQAMLTGRNHHSVGMGGTTEMSTSAPGYTGFRPRSAATLAQILQGNGYSTAAFGKWHQTPPREISAVGPFHRWPTGEGFDHFYGFMGAEMNHWYPLLYKGTTPVEPDRRPEDGYHLSEDLVDQAISWVWTQRTLTPDRPFFTYLAFGASHAPLHVAPEWQRRYRGRFDYPIAPVGWALALNTPYQWTKQVASHLGGTRDGLIVAWPRRIADQGGLRHQFHHVIDVLPTVLDCAGIPEPTIVNGAAQQPVEGISMRYTFDTLAAPDRRRTQYFEMCANRGIYHEGWMAVTRHGTPWEMIPTVRRRFSDDVWELYDLTRDWTQAHDLAHEHPDRLRALQDLYLVEAAKHQVFPLDDRVTERENPVMAGRVDLLDGRRSVTYRGRMRRFTEEVVLEIDGEKQAEGRVEQTIPYYFSFDETLDVGVDLGTPVTDDYPEVDNEFRDVIHTVRIDLGEERGNRRDGGLHRRVMTSQ